MQKTPVAYVLSTFPVLSETFVGTEMRALMEQGHPVLPIVLQRPTTAFQEADQGLAERVVHLDRIAPAAALARLARPHRDAGRGVAFLRAQHLLPRASLLWNAAKIAAAAQSAGCRHLHAHFAGGAAAHAIVAARLIGARVSFVCHGHDVYAEPEDLPAKLRWADAVVAVCDDLADDLRALAPEARIERIPCGIDPARFTPVPPGTPDNGCHLFIGRLVEQKGLADLLDAMARLLPAWRIDLDVVGDGPDRAGLEALAATLGVSGQVRFLGARQSGWIAAHGPLYRSLIAPFKAAANGERDTGPVVVKEAMAMGLPVIATRFMGLKEMVTPDTGILVAPADSDALAHALVMLDSAPSPRRCAMGRAARLRVLDHFTANRQGRLLSALVQAP